MDIEINQIKEIDDSKMEIIISGINNYSTSEIREIIENAFSQTKPENK